LADERPALTRQGLWPLRRLACNYSLSGVLQLGEPGPAASRPSCAAPTGPGVKRPTRSSS
jgi:hypothetical protein